MNVANKYCWPQHQAKGYTLGGQHAASDVKLICNTAVGDTSTDQTICPYGFLPTVHTVKQSHPDLSRRVQLVLLLHRMYLQHGIKEGDDPHRVSSSLAVQSKEAMYLLKLFVNSLAEM